MAKTTAVIDGDSSGLVGALDKGKAGMEKMEAEGKKLSDQLREVTDSVDKAAGALVQKIGGPTAIKAIAGVGAAMGAAKMVTDAFLGSAESLFKSFGDEGVKVWDETEKSLFAIKGAFAEAVLGGGSVEEMGARLKGIFEGVKFALDALLLPLRALSGLIQGLSTGFDDLAGNVLEASDRLDQLAGKVRVEGLKANAAGIEELRLKLLGLTGQTEILRQLELKRDIAKAQALKNDVMAAEMQADALESAAVVLANQGEIEKKANAKQQEYIRSLGEEKLTRAQLAEARRIYSAEVLAQGQALMAQQLKQREGISEANKAQLADLDTMIAQYQELAKTPVTATGGGGPKENPLTKALEDAKAKAVGVRFHFKTMAVGIAEDIAKAQVDAAKAASDTIDAVIAAARERVGTAVATSKTEADKVGEAQKAAMEANYNLFVSQNAKMVAVSLAGGAKMADVARAAIGNIVSALGDKAMAEAGLMLATGNLAGAAALTAAGAAAYATAAFLGATDKKSGSSTKATTAATAPTVTNNTAFNLQIDAAFADEESIARSFAKAQALARARHMTPYAMT